MIDARGEQSGRPEIALLRNVKRHLAFRVRERRLDDRDAGPAERPLQPTQVLREVRDRLERNDPATRPDLAAHPVGERALVCAAVNGRLAAPEMAEHDPDFGALGPEPVAPRPVTESVPERNLAERRGPAGGVGVVTGRVVSDLNSLLHS